MLPRIILVVGFGREKTAVFDPGRDWLPEHVPRLELGDEAFRLRGLVRILREDRASVARPDVRSLPIHLGRVMRDRKVNLEQLGVTYLRRVVGDPDGLGVA